MIYLYNTKLELLEVVNEVSFSYSKKAGKEGGGKVTLLSPSHKDSFYIIIYAVNDISGEDEYITSGYITELIEEKTGFSFQFKTFEGFLKDHVLPKKWNMYKSLYISEIVTDLTFGFRPIYKTSKADLKVLNSTNPTILMCKNIAFGEIEGADLTLAFDANKKKEENVYYYCDKGFILFQYDLGVPNFARVRHSDSEIGKYSAHFPMRILRWSEQVGEKTFIKWQALEIDEKIQANDNNGIAALLSKLEKAPILQARRDKKNHSIEEGIRLPNTKKVLILKLIFEYIKPDYVHDFNTQEINPKVSKEGVKVKRTVRGFTPILHGFEILNRCSLSPFSLASDGKPPTPTRTIIEVAGRLSERCDPELVKFDGAKFSDVLTKMQEVYKFNVTFDLRKGENDNKAEFYISLFTDDAVGKTRFHGRDLRFKKEALLKGADVVPICANFTLAKMKRKLELPILIDCKGEGSEVDAIRFVFYINYILEGGAYRREVFVYGADGVDKREFNEVLQVIPVSSAFIDNIKTMPYIEETLEANKAKTPRDVANALLKYLVDKENKVSEETFEAAVFQDVRLYDYVRILHSKSAKAYDVFIKEEKINSKNGKITKTVGLAGDIYNPFDCFFSKKQQLPIITLPTMPLDVKVTSHKNNLRIEWTAQGVYDEFKIKLECRDGVVDDGWYSRDGIDYTRDYETWTVKIDMVWPSYRDLSTTSTFIELTTLECNVIYKVSVASCYQNEKSEYTTPIYFKMEDSDSHIRHLSSLKEEGEDGDEAYFYDDYEELRVFGGKLSEEEEKNHYLVKLYNITGYSPKFFNSIEQITDKGLDLDIFDIKEGEFEGGDYSYITHHIPYTPYLCNSWEESFYEEVANFYGKYYVWSRKKWRERRWELPAKPLVFFDLEQRATPELTDILEYKDFVKRWQEYYDAVQEYQKLRMYLDKQVAYYNYGEGNNPKQRTNKDWSIGDTHDIKPFAAGGGGFVPKDPIGPGKPPEHHIPGEPPDKPPEKEREQDDLPFYPEPSEDQKIELEKKKQELVDCHEKIRKIIYKRYSSKSLSIAELWRGADKKNVIYDASGEEHHLNYRLTGWQMLNDVYTEFENDDKELFLQHAFRFFYADLDNGGIDDREVEVIKYERPSLQRHDDNFEFLEGYSHIPSLQSTQNVLDQSEIDILLGKVKKVGSTKYQLSFGITDYAKDNRIPFYQRDTIPFISKAINKSLGTEENPRYQGEVEFTFSTWVRITSSTDEVCIWDIYGMCVGYLKDGKLHIAHRKANRGKMAIEFPFWDFLIVDYSRSDLQGNSSNENQKNGKPFPFFHVMVQCKVSKIEAKLPDVLTGVVKQRCNYTITQDIFLNFKKVQKSDYEKVEYGEANKHSFWYISEKKTDEDFRLEDSKLSFEECSKLADEFNKYLHLEDLPAFRIAYFEEKPMQPYNFEKAEKKRFIYTEKYDKTDYMWHSYDFELSQVMLFKGFLPKLQRFYLREYGVYPVKRLPVKYPQDEGGGGSTGGGGGLSGSHGQSYLGIVQEKVERHSNIIKTLRGGDKEIIAGYGEFFLMAIDCKNFTAGALYKWDGQGWVELSPLVNYPRECRDAFDDIKALPRVSQAHFYKEFATFGIAICNAVFTPTVMTDSLSVIGNATMLGLPDMDPHKKGALFTRDGILHVSKG